MSCKSALYCINTNSPTLQDGASIPVGMTVRRFGSNIRTDGFGILIQGAGYYDLNGSFTLTPSAASTITVQLYQDGVAVPGALASETVAAADTTINLSFPAMIRLQGCRCNTESSTLEFRLTGGEVVLNNAATVTERQ